MTHIISSIARRWRHGIGLLAGAGLLALAMTAPGQGQGNDMAALQVRIGQLEEQVRTFSGQIEGLQFQMTQMQTLIERMQEDNEFRFQQLEGGSLGETDAVTTDGGAMPTDGLPQENGTNGSEIEGSAPQASPDNTLTGDEDIVGESVEMGSDDNLYASDVFGEGGVILGAPEGELGSTPPSQPLNLEFDPGAGEISDGDANAQYQAGYDAVVRGEYAFAEEQFRQFVAAFPDHAQAPDATYWLGETMIQRGAHGEAADVLLTGFERFPTSNRAPDILLKLGVALHGAGEFDTACRTYGEVLRRYPESTQAFKDRVADEQARAGC